MRGRTFVSFRLSIQSAIKSIGRAAGVEIRYAFQNPSIYDPAIYAHYFGPTEVKCVFDVGANVGHSAKGFARAFPYSTIHSFEPFPASYRRLAQVADASRGQIKAYRFACGNSDGYVQSDANPGSTWPLNRISTSLLAPVRPTDGKLVIEVRRVDTICNEVGVNSIDVLKTDTEGCDAEVLAGASGMLAARGIRSVVSEVGFGDDYHTRFEDVFVLLAGHGFELAGLYEITYLSNGRCDFANALFIRG
jgi:FkbM family methyltransferase